MLCRSLAILLGLFSTARAELDLNRNGLGDVWEAKFAPAVFAPDEDSDGDGRTNAEEARAGTDPLRADDVFKIRKLTAENGGFRLQWPSQAGKRYRVQSSTNPDDATAWLDLPGVMEGDGDDLESFVTLPPAERSFFRIVVSDVDTDGDGLTDWEELQAGFDPHHDHQHACGGGDCCEPGSPCSGGDLERMTAGLLAEPLISVHAEDPDSGEPAIGATATDPGRFLVTRKAGLRRVVVALQSSGTTSPDDLEALPETLVLPLGVNSIPLPVIPLADKLVESTEVVFLTPRPSEEYTVAAGPTEGVLVRDHVAATGNGLTANFWQHPGSTSNAPYFTGAPTLSRIDPQVNFHSDTIGGVAGSPWPGSPVNSNYFSSRWEGEILPEFSQAYTFFSHTDNGGRLSINGQVIINNWPPASVSTSEQSAVIVLEAGKRYPIVYEHYNNTSTHRAILSWQSQSQPKQVVPRNRLFPDTPPRLLGPFEAWAFIGGPPFSLPVAASGRPTSFTATNLPAGFSIHPATGLITGTPATPGTWTVTLTATNAHGSDSAFLTLNLIQNSGQITREKWTGIPGSGLASIPLDQTPDATSVLASLQAPENDGDAYGVRIRGFLTAPATGDYRFFLRADDAAAFFLSDDDEPVNAWKRAELSAPVPASGWAAAAPSPLLRLEAGRRYYLEILHKEDAGADHLALGWAKPGEPNHTPSEAVPGYVLTRFDELPLGSGADGTLFFTALTPQSGAVTNAYGSSTLRLSADRKTAWVTPEFGNLGSPFQGMHIHDDRLPPTSNIVFDLDEGSEILPDGSYVWHIQGTGGLSAEQIADGIGLHAFFNVHSQLYPAGEIKGYFKALDGSSNFTPPPPPPDWTAQSAASHTDAKAAARFLQQATFGASPADIAALRAMPSFEAWIEAEFRKPATHHLPRVEQLRNVTSPNSPTYGGTLSFNTWWKNSIQSEDQLRQRLAFALSQIMVISESGPLDDRAHAVSSFYDTLLDHAFGNVRELMEQVTLHPAMGRYLDMLRNDKPNLTAGSIPNENYAREILQLFSLGLYRFHPDGSLVLNSKGLPIPVYDQEAVIGLSHVFTGWDYGYTGSYRTSFGASSNWTGPMREVPARHFVGKKRILNNVVLPGLPDLDPYATHSSTVMATPAYQGLPAAELAAVHDQIFNHPNLGPFLCRQLIQRLVTSTPSRGYIHRVVSKFNDNGSGVRGDMKAVLKAILLDYEARSPAAASAPGYGKQREPVLRVTQFARAFRPENNFAGTYQQDGGLILVDTSPTPHRLANSQKVLLGFSGPGTQATDYDYSVTSAVTPTPTSFAVRTRDVHRCSWAQSGSTLTITTPSTHTFDPGESVYLRFRSGAAGVLTDGVHLVATSPSSSTFTVTAPDSASRSGQLDAAWLNGVYSQSYSSTTGITTLTVTCASVTGLGIGAKLDLTFTPVTGQTTTPPAGRYTIVTVDPSDPRRYTLTPDSGIQSTLNGRSGSFHAATPTPVLDRSGTAVSGYSDWAVNSTDTDLGQTPLRSPTVFNFFEPDYKFPGLLASKGLVTPEFQLSSETNVIRQANFLFGGIYSTSTTSPSLTAGYTNGFSSFKSNGHDIMMDFSPWMGPRTTGTDYWTNTANLRELIRALSNLLMAGQMTTAMENEIYNFVSNTANIAYGNNPSESERRNRARAVINFIAVSPEHAIQR
jgi:hypothetical protein